MANDDLKRNSFVRSLCVGEIDEGIIFPYPKMKDSEKELCRSVLDSFKSWMSPKSEDYRKWDREGHMPDEYVEEIRQLGLFGLIIPEEFGGMGFSTSAYSRCIQEISRYDGATALTVGAHSSIGMRGLLMFGTPEQKAKYLPKLTTGEMIAAYCLTESGSGSDAGSIKTRAVKEGDHWVLNGEKIWISNGGIAQFFTVFAVTDTPEGKITAFLVTRDMGGVTNGPHEDKMGIRANTTTTIHFDNVKVPVANVLGEVGKGFKIAVKILNNGRTGLGGGCVGGMKKCIELATKQAKERKQFGKSISEYGLIKQKVGQMVVDCYVTESVVNMVSGLIDAGYEDYAVEAAISKVMASENLWTSVDQALQIAAGNGYMREFPYERLMRDCRINRIFEGTNEILTLFIALTAMADAAHQLKELVNVGPKVFADPIKGFGVFAEYASKRISFATTYGSAKVTKMHSELKAYAIAYEAHVRSLGSAVDRILRKHGKEIIGKQFATKRLAQILIDMYAMGCLLSRVSQAIEEKGKKEAAMEIKILETFFFQANDRIAQTYAKIDDNEDEGIKELADFAFEKEAYTWDNL